MRSLKIILSIAAPVAAIAILYTTVFNPFSTDKPSTDLNGASTSSSGAASEDNASGTSLGANESSDSLVAQSSSATDSLNTQTGDVQLDSTQSNVELNTSLNNEQSSSATLADSSSQASASNQSNQDNPTMFGYEVALEQLSDEEFLALSERLKQDSFLVEELLNELRIEADPERLKRLTALLGSVASVEMLPVVEELVYSASPSTRAAGLDLLSRIAPLHAEAYDTALNILSSESDPEVLVDTMNVLVLPSNASTETLDAAVTQVISLTEHESADVRRHSVSILSRLTNDESVAQVLSNGLNDSDESVRSAATYAYANQSSQSPESVEHLLQVTENTNESNGVRQGAIFALEKLSPDQQTQARIDAAKRQMTEARRLSRQSR